MLDVPDDELTLFGEGGGQAVIACPREDVAALAGVPLRELGVVGGERICGITLAEARAAWDTDSPEVT